MLTFNNVEESENGKVGRKKSGVAIMGVPFDLASTEHSGQRRAPYAIRESGFWEPMRHLQLGIDPLEVFDVVDVGDVEITTADAAKSWQSIRDNAKKVYANTHCLISIGGDHSISAKVAQGIVDTDNQPLTIFHFDAHGDYERHDPGVELHHGSWVRHSIENGVANRVVQFGVRGWGISSADKLWADKNDVTTYYATQPDWMKELRDEVQDTSDHIYLSIDVDVLDPAFAPGVAYPEPGGLTTRELFSAIQIIASSGKMVGADVVEVIPALDPSGITIKLANRCVAQLVTGLACSPAK